MDPPCTAVVVHFACPTRTGACLDALAVEGVPAVVVDHGGAGVAPGGLRADLGPRPGATVVGAPGNEGYGAGVNRGARAAAAATYLLVLNNDVRLRPGGLAALVAVLEGDPGLAAVAPFAHGGYSPDPATWFRGGGFDWTKGASRYAGRGAHPDLGPEDGPRDTEFLEGSCLLVRAEAFRKVGGFAEDYFLYAEDEELSLHLRARGWRLAVTAAAVAEHEGQGSQRGAADVGAPLLSPANPRLPVHAYYLARNRLRNARAYARGGDRLRFLVGYPLYTLAKWCQFLLAGRPDGVCAWARGLADGLRGRGGPMPGAA